MYPSELFLYHLPKCTHGNVFLARLMFDEMDCLERRMIGLSE